MPSSINFKDIGQLSQKSTIAGTEKIPVSDTEYVTTQQIASLGGGGGDTSSCVHKTGDESIAGDKTFTDDIVVGDASNIVYGASSGSGFTADHNYQEITESQSIEFEVSGEPKAFIIISDTYYSTAVVMSVVGDSTGCHGVYNTGSQHNYSNGYTTSYANGIFTVTAPSGQLFDGEYHLYSYYGSGTLTFHTTQVAPGSGVTSVTFTDTYLTAMPALYSVFLETAVNNESYRRVACVGSYPGTKTQAYTFYTNTVANTTSSFTISYSNGLVINSGGTNAGGYFHNPGTYTLYYLMASDIGGGGGSYQSLSAELSAITTSVSAKEATSNKVTSLSAQSTDTQYPSAKLLYDQLALKQNSITISSSEPTAYQGNNGDIWIVI